MKKVWITVFWVVLLAGTVISCKKEEDAALLDLKADGKENTFEIMPTVILLSHAEVRDSSTQQMALRLKENLEQISGGMLFLDIYLDNTLGGFEESRRALEEGTVQMRIGQCGSALISILTFPDISGMDREELEIAMEEEPLRSILEEELLNSGLHYLGKSPLTYAVLSSNRAVRKLVDFQDLRVRIMGYSLSTVYWEALGAEPVVFSASEVYSALQQNLADANAQNPLHVLMSRRIHEQQRYIIETDHQIYIEPIYASETFYQSLTEEQKGWLLEALQLTLEEERENFEKVQQENLQRLQEEGVEVLTLSDGLRTQIREKVKEPLLLQCYQNYGEEQTERLLEMIQMAH